MFVASVGGNTSWYRTLDAVPHCIAGMAPTFFSDGFLLASLVSERPLIIHVEAKGSSCKHLEYGALLA